MNFTESSQDELRKLNIIEGNEYLIEYVNKDYFNGESTIEKVKAKAVINDNEIIFVAPDPYGMERFIKKARVIA